MINVGDKCLYSYGTRNKSQCIVKVKDILSEDVAEINILYVICDDSGNGLFHYLCDTKKPMNASIKYLKKIASIECSFLMKE